MTSNAALANGCLAEKETEHMGTLPLPNAQEGRNGMSRLDTVCLGSRKSPITSLGVTLTIAPMRAYMLRTKH
jgi:hypothetical protein